MELTAIADDVVVQGGDSFRRQRAEVAERPDTQRRDDAQWHDHGHVGDRPERSVLLDCRLLKEDGNAPVHECVEDALASERVAPWTEGEARVGVRSRNFRRQLCGCYALVVFVDCIAVEEVGSPASVSFAGTSLITTHSSRF